MAKTTQSGDKGVIPGIVAVPAKPAASQAFKPTKQDAALPKGDINPFVNAGGKKAK